MSYDLLRLSLCSSICSYQIIKKRYRCVCLYNNTFMPFGIEHLRRAIVSCSTSPPNSTTTHKPVLYCEYAPLVDGTVLRCLSSGWSVCPLPFNRLTVSGGRRRDIPSEWVARPTNHLVQTESEQTHHTRSYPGLSPGSIPGLSTSSAILGRQHRIPSDLRS